MFQIVWFSCAVGAAQGRSWPGILATVLLVALHLTTASHWKSAALTVLAAGALGFFAETLLVVTGLVRYSASWPTPMLAPAWIVALWLAFGATLEPTRRLLGPNALVTAIFLGSVLGPLSYFAGERLGALALAPPPWLSYLAVAMIWALALPALMTVERRSGYKERAAAATESDSV
jgi:hypothetical protein